MKHLIMMMGAGFVALQILAVMGLLATTKARSTVGFDTIPHPGPLPTGEGEDSTLSSELAIRTTVAQDSDGVATLA